MLTPPSPSSSEGGEEEGEGGEAHQDNPVPPIIGVSLVLGFIFLLFVDQVKYLHTGCLLPASPFSSEGGEDEEGEGGEGQQDNPVPRIIGVLPRPGLHILALR
jgi:hypothetical protein